METLVPNFHNRLDIFHTAHSGIKDVIDNTQPEYKYVVIEELPNKDRATYCVHTPEGWVVYSKLYRNKDVVYPSIYGLLFRKLDIDQFSEASINGMSIDTIYKICEEIYNGNFTNPINNVVDT